VIMLRVLVCLLLWFVFFFFFVFGEQDVSCSQLDKLKSNRRSSIDI